MTQPSLYPSPPGQPHPAEDSNYSKSYSSLLYMNGDHHVPPPPISYAGHTEPSLPSLYGGSLGGSLGGDHYQPYSVSSMGYEESTPAFSAAALSTVESTMAHQKYDAWSSEPSVIQPVMSSMGYPMLGHAHSLAIKQEYIPPAYISPSPSSMAGGSSIKTELMSDTSRSPPPGSDPQMDGLVIPLQPTSACPSPRLLQLPKDKRTPVVKSETPAGKKPTRNSNNYGDQYACPECRRTFARQCGLTQHTKWHHSGEKPFRCLTCGKIGYIDQPQP
uniref:C2H2-type domain-containing protein n=1 Tax=Anopheles christyi TaxID=43041 RepID=A0A182JYX7_9DIPT